MTPAEEQAKKLTEDLRRQLREEIGDDETLLNAMRMRLGNPKLLVLQYKFGLAALPELAAIASHAKGARQ